MGNSVDVTLIQNSSLEITSNLVRDFQKEICIVDQTMSGLSKSVESLRASCELFLRQIDTKQMKSEGDDTNDSRQSCEKDEEQLIVQILRTIDESISDQKISAMRSLKKLLFHLVDIGRSYIDISDESLSELFINRHAFRQKENDEIFDTFPYYETRVKSLREQIEAANALNKHYRDEIDILNEKEITYLEERNTLRQRYTQIEEELMVLKAEMDQIENVQHESKTSESHIGIEKEGTDDITGEDFEKIYKFDVEDDENIDEPKETLIDDQFQEIAVENKRLKAINECLENKLDTIMSKEFIHVQLFNTGPKTMPVEELTEILQEKINTDKCHLYMNEIRNKSDLTYDIPILVMAYSSQGPSNAAAAAMKDIKVTSAVILVLVHRDIQPSSIRSSEAVILTPEYKKLGGIFDLVNNFQKGIFSCPLNDTNISDIVGFINNNGVKIPKVKTYGLCD